MSIMSRTAVGDRIRIGFYFDTQILDALQKIAALKNTSYSELIRVACREYVIREAPGAMAASTAIRNLNAVPAGTDA
jgi:metal-responsive CopG/Arc/MetJ family transcriptional regulator